MMEKIYVLCPADYGEYLRILTDVTPKLDDAGISFCVTYPSEDIADLILNMHSRNQ